MNSTSSHSSHSSQIWDHIVKSERILLHCHPNADGDSVGSALAMAHVLTNLGKKVMVIAGDNDQLPRYLSFLPGYNIILAKDFFQVDLANFDLFLILDTASPSQISRKAPILFPLTIPSIVIDHHASNTLFGNENFVNTESPATCQILYELFKEWGVDISHDIALCLFIGIYTDTGGFKYPLTTERTFQIAAELTNKVPEFTDHLFTLANTTSPTRIGFMKVAYANVKIWYHSVAVSSISYKEIVENKIDNDGLDTSGFAGILKTVTGWDIGIMCTEEKEGETKVSFRTRDLNRYNVAKLAIVLGGGGHPAAAATYIKAPLEKTLKQIYENLPKVYPELTFTVSPISEKQHI